MNSVHSSESVKYEHYEEGLPQPHPHTELYSRNLTLINITNFRFLINRDICNVSALALVTIVHSAMEHEDARNVIRWSRA